MNNSNLLKQMSDTIMSQIYDYGMPDGSDYSKYIKSPADKYFSQIKDCIESVSVLEPLLCWCMYEAVNIHNVQNRPFDEQHILESNVISKAEGLKISEIKKNKELLIYARQKAGESLNVKILSFISYCIFADSGTILNGHAYWEQINKTVLAKVYMDALNANCKKTWKFPPRFFMMLGGHPKSVGPDVTKGPFYRQTEKKELITDDIYFPLSDSRYKLASQVVPEESCISIEETCDWATLDFIIKPEIDKIHYPKLYSQNKPYSLRRGVSNLFKLIFNNWADGKEKDSVQDFVSEIYKDFFWVWHGKIPKTEIGYFEGKPAVVYCLYKTARYADQHLFVNQFSMNNKWMLNDEWEHFQKMLQTGDTRELPFNIAIATHEARKKEERMYDFYKEQNDEDRKNLEKMQNGTKSEIYSLLCMMTFFFMWDMARTCHTECFVTEEDLKDYFIMHGDLQEEFYKSFSDEPWNKEPTEDSEDRDGIDHFQTNWTDPKHLVKLMNLLLEAFDVNNRAEHFPLSVFDTKNFGEKSNAVAILLYNFCNLDQKSRDKLLNVMDYVGELKDRKNIYCQPRKIRKLDSQSADEEIFSVKENQRLLKNIDCGFEVKNYIQMPVLCNDAFRNDYYLQRKFTCRFFSDTDKLYSYKKRGIGKKLEDGTFDRYCIDYKENYRLTNKNNFYCHTLYTAERNTARHYNDMHSLENILDDSYPEHLLEALKDARDFLLELTIEKNNDKQQIFLIKYLIDFVDRHLKTYAQKLDLIDFNKNEDIWDQLFTADKNIQEEVRNRLDCNIEYEKIFGRQYIQEIKWFFQNLYCLGDVFTNMYYTSIAIYLFYLTLRFIEL